MIDLEFLTRVNTLKARYPCSTTSLDRTPLYNQNEGGAKKSWHLSTTPGGCKAIDLIFDTPENLIPAAKYARDLGFSGIELDYTDLHLHLDQRDTVQWHVVKTQSDTYTLEEYLTVPI